MISGGRPETYTLDDSFVDFIEELFPVVEDDEPIPVLFALTWPSAVCCVDVVPEGSTAELKCS